MIELGINEDVIRRTQLFLMDQKVQLVIDRYKTKEKDIETGILQRFTISSIFLWIYINRVFDELVESNLGVTSLFFIDDLGFILSRSLIKDIAKILKNVTKVVLE